MIPASTPGVSSCGVGDAGNLSASARTHPGTRIHRDDDDAIPVRSRARHNAASLRALEKCGFAVSGYDRAPAGIGGEEGEEAILRLV